MEVCRDGATLRRCATSAASTQEIIAQPVTALASAKRLLLANRSLSLEQSNLEGERRSARYLAPTISGRAWRRLYKAGILHQQLNAKRAVMKVNEDPVIEADVVVTTFIQHWSMSGESAQRDWLSAMHDRVYLLQRQPGFRSMTLLPSLDAVELVVYAQWDSEGQFQAAVQNPSVAAARIELDKHGKPEGGLYRVASINAAQADPDHRMLLFPAAAGVVFVNFWTMKDGHTQQELIAQMEPELPVLASREGALGFAVLPSLDGTRVAICALWASLAAYNIAVGDDAASKEVRARLAQYAQPKVNLYRVDRTFLPKVSGYGSLV